VSEWDDFRDMGVSTPTQPKADPLSVSRAPQEQPLRQGCACSCCDHAEGSDCACECHASGLCASRAPADPLDLERINAELAAFPADAKIAYLHVNEVRALVAEVERLTAENEDLRMLLKQEGEK